MLFTGSTLLFSHTIQCTARRLQKMSKNTPSTFHRFGDLPQELRIEIWKHVVRRRCPAVSMFSLHGDPSLLAFSKSSGKFFDLAAGPPRCAPKPVKYGWLFTTEETVAPSWDAHNPSLYLIDSGLWNACRESHALIRRLYGVDVWESIHSILRHKLRSCNEHPQARLGGPARARFVDGNGEDRYFAVLPNTDLFYFQPRHLQAFKWQQLIPFGKDKLKISLLKNIALELDPAWGVGLATATPQDIARHPAMNFFAVMAVQVSYVTTIWLVDYRLKRKAIAPTLRQATGKEGRIFYGSNCRFVEVMGEYSMDHDKWEIIPEEEEEEEAEREGRRITRATGGKIFLVAWGKFVVEPWNTVYFESEDEGESSPDDNTDWGILEDEIRVDEDGDFADGEMDEATTASESESGAGSDAEAEWLFRGDWFIAKIRSTITYLSNTWGERYTLDPNIPDGREVASFGLLACEYY
ncbi:hypothetical protein V8C37DRAFT_364721 [Trichoderma ceciliae]